MLGREQVITKAFFASPVLLRKGLVDDSIELGWLRNNYGIDSNSYKNPFGVITYRKGLRGNLTGEARVEIQRNINTAGVSFAAALPEFSSVVESSFVLSAASGLATGTMANVRYSYLGSRWSANLRMQLFNEGFRQLGSDVASLPRQIVTAALNAPWGDGILSLNYVRRRNQGERLTRIAHVSYSRRISANAFASFTFVKPLSESNGSVAALTLIFVAGTNRVGSATLNRQANGTALNADFQRATPRDTGTGYRLAAVKGADLSRQEASLVRNQSFGSFQMDAVRMDRATSLRQNARGSIASLGDGVYFTRAIDQGFAVVQTSDISGVPVLLENQIVAHTNSRGRALVRNLQAYQPNRISIDPLHLPLQTSIRSIERSVIPRSQGGVLVDFNVNHSRSATLTIIRADGSPMPPWTPIEVVGMEDAFVVGERGEVFVELPALVGNRVIVRPEADPVCELRVDQPLAGSTSPFLGPLKCD